MKPDFCPKAYCITDHKDCPKCKYAFYKGEGIDSTDKLWRWEYRPRHGPNFVRKDGQLLKYQPIVGDPAWELFEKWEKKRRL